MASLIPGSASKVFTVETLRPAAKQSQGIHLVSLRLRRAIKRFLRDEEKAHMNRKVLSLFESFSEIKDSSLQLSSNTSKEPVEDPLKSMERSKRWKIKSSYGDIGLKYRDDETVAYVASHMPAVYSACHRVLREVRRSLPDFSPTRVLDFGFGLGTALWSESAAPIILYGYYVITILISSIYYLYFHPREEKFVGVLFDLFLLVVGKRELADGISFIIQDSLGVILHSQC